MHADYSVTSRFRNSSRFAGGRMQICMLLADVGVSPSFVGGGLTEC